MEDRAKMKLEVLKAEVLGKLDGYFRRKVQLTEEIQENDIQLQFSRGVLFAFDQAQKVLIEAGKAEKIEGLKIKKFELKQRPGSSESAGSAEGDGSSNGSKSPETIPPLAKASPKGKGEYKT